MEQWFEKSKKEISKAEYNEIKELIRKIFSQRLKELRKASGLTLKELATLSGTSDSYLSQLENGRRNPPKVDLLSSIARGLTSTPYTIKGSPKTRKILSEYSRTYSELFESAGYKVEDKRLLEEKKTESTNDFLISYKNILNDFYLNYSNGTETIDENKLETPPEYLRFIIYQLNHYKNDNSIFDFENEKMILSKLFERMISSIEENLKQ